MVFLSKESVDNLVDECKKLDSSEYCNDEEVAKLLGYKISTTKVFLRSGRIKTYKNPISLKRKTKRTDVQNYLKDIEKENKLLQNEYTIFDIRTKNYDTSRCERTKHLYHEFITRKLNSSNATSPTHYAGAATKAFLSLAPLLDKELYLYNDAEISQLLIHSELLNRHKDCTISFLKFLKNQRDIKCTFKNDYTLKKAKTKNKDDLEYFYTAEEWGEMYRHLIDLDNHIEKALFSIGYSRAWLYAMMHLFTSWRSSDFTKLPDANLDLVGIYDFEWFYNNTFTLSLGEKILEDVRIKSESIFTNKTGVRAHFVVTVDAIIPCAIAFVIAEIHRRKDKNQNIILKNNDIKLTGALGLVMNGSAKLPRFSSLKCNRSLLTHSHDYASRSAGSAYLAYDLSTYLRSHIKSDMEIASTTAKYIYATNSDGSVSDISYNLFKRGFWGWLYKDIISISNLKNKNKLLTLEEETTLISMLKNTYSPIEIENMASFLKIQLDERISVVKELLNMSKKELQLTISNLINKKMPSKHNSSQCLKSGNCPYISAESCIGCKYLIPEYYMLYSINLELLYYIDKLECTPMENDNERIKYTYYIKKMLYLIQEAKREYEKYDNQFIATFINLPDIKEKLIKLQNTKFKELED